MKSLYFAVFVMVLFFSLGTVVHAQQKTTLDSIPQVPKPQSQVELDSIQLEKRSLDQKIIEMDRQIEALRRKERLIEIEQEKKLRESIRQEKINLASKRESRARALQRMKSDSIRTYHYNALNNFKNAISLELSSIIVNELRLEYYRNVYKTVSVGIELGYKPGYSSLTDYTRGLKNYSYMPFTRSSYVVDNDGRDHEIVSIPFTKSYYVGLGAKIPLHTMSAGRHYVSVVGFARNSSYQNSVFKYEQGSGLNNAYITDSSSADQTSYGLKLLMGFRKIYMLDKIALEFDGFLGLGFSNVTTSMYYYSRTSKTYSYPGPITTVETDVAEKRTLFLVRPHVGLKVGIRF